jgi:DNA-binding PucR family transcriptional regulator
MKADRFSFHHPDESTSAVPLQISGRHALYVNIYQQDRFQYRLLVLEMDTGIRPSAPYLLEYLSIFIQLAIGFVVDESLESTTLPFLIKSILSGENTDANYIRQQFEEFDWHQEHSYLLARIYADLPDYKNRTLRFMSDQLQSVFPRASVFEYENNITLLFNLDIAGHDQKTVEKMITAYLQDNNLKAGISHDFHGFEYLRQYYTQAGVALRLGPRTKPYQWLHRFVDVIESFILDSCTEKLPAWMISDERLLRLKEYDKLHNQDLYNTLYVYLKNNMKAVKAAKELFIHRSTFLYRLERIDEVMGVPLESDHNLWYLLLSYKLLEEGGN